MAPPSYVFVRGLKERIEEELYEQNMSKLELADRCGFGRSVLCRDNIHLAYFMQICYELDVSADYLLFGKKR